MIFFTKNANLKPKKKKFFFLEGGGGRGEGARVSKFFFNMNPNLK